MAVPRFGLALLAAILPFGVFPSGSVLAQASPSSASSPAAVEWTQVIDPDLAGFGAQRILGLTADDGIVLAWGETLVQIGPEEGDVQQGGVIWRSTDGAEWVPSLVTDGVAMGDTSGIGDVAHGPGGWVAIGYVCCGTEEAAVWRSEDAATWRRVPFPSVPLPGVRPDRIGLAAIAGSLDRYVIAGLAVTGEPEVVPVLWSSADGQTWTAADAMAGGEAGQLDDVAWDGERFVAVGHLGASDAPDLDGLVLRSSDGLTWAPAADTDGRLSAPGDILLTEVVPYADGLLLVGARGDSAARLDCPGDCVTFRSAAWTSGEEDTWEEVAGAVPSIAAASDDGLMGFGENRLLRSANGRTWSAPRQTGGLVTDEVVESVVAWGGEWFAAGSGPDPLDGNEDGDGRIWRIAVTPES